jgi:hypothetical protein
MALGGVLVALLLGAAASAAAADGEMIELSSADRQALEALLGNGVVGKAVAAAPLSSDLEPLREGTWTYRIVGGDAKGSEQRVVSQLKRDSSGKSWRYGVGSDYALFLTQTADGGVVVQSEQDTSQGVISRFSPPEPLLVPGLQPGATKDYTIAVKVYDLSHPDHETHSGSLKLTYSYLGAYEVTVPVGTMNAALIKSVYQGKVGPANVEDTQYRFVVDKTGMVAAIEKKKISALLLYHDDSKSGRVLEKQP